MPLLDPNQSYTFSQYFELGFEARELVALDQWEAAPTVSEQPILVGAVSTGTIWQFGTLDRTAKQFEQGLNSYRVPEDLEPLMRILVAALKQTNSGGLSQ